MNGSENLWSDDELLTQMEAMQSQIEKLKEENTELIRQKKELRELSQYQKQKHSSEALELQSALREAERKIQEQSEKIVRLNNADLILKENERLKNEMSKAGLRNQALEDEYMEKFEDLKRKAAYFSKEEKEAKEMVRNLKTLIKTQAEELSGYKIRCLQAEFKEEKRNILDREMKKEVKVVFGFLIFIAVLMIIAYIIGVHYGIFV